MDMSSMRGRVAAAFFTILLAAAVVATVVFSGGAASPAVIALAMLVGLTGNICSGDARRRGRRGG